MKRILPREVSIIGFGRTQSQSWHGPKESPEERETQRDSCGFVEIPVIGYMLHDRCQLANMTHLILF
jgi:hypothetical protein